MKKRNKVIVGVLCLFLISGMIVNSIDVRSSTVSEYDISNPRVEDDLTTWDCVYFGNYWQNDTNEDGVADENDEKEPIKWRVLSVDGNDAFLLADKSLDFQQYNETGDDVIWETCTLRTWLNEEFFNESFSKNEQNTIKTTQVTDEGNTVYEIPSGNNTNDKIYLPSLTEVTNSIYGFNNTINNEKTRMATATKYVIKQRMNDTTGSSEFPEDKESAWGLRTHNKYRSNGIINGESVPYTLGLIVRAYGRIAINSPNMTTAAYYFDIRPCLHIDLSSNTWSYAGTVNSDGEVNEPTSELPTPTVEPTSTTKPTEDVVATEDPTTTPTPEKTPEVAATATPMLESTEYPTIESTATTTIEPTPWTTVTSTSTEEPSSPSPVLTNPTPTQATTQNYSNNTVTTSTTQQKIINNTQQKATVTKPSKPKISSVKNNKKKTVTITWKKVSGAVGYQIQYATNDAFSRKSKTTSKTKISIKKLKTKKTYSFRIRAYKLNGKTKVYGKWSNVKRIKIKK